MFKKIDVDFKEFMNVVDKCEGGVYAITEENDMLNLKSKLSQLVGIIGLIEGGKIQIKELKFDKITDETKVLRFLLYNEMP